MVRVCRAVPKEWTRFPPVGAVIPNTQFIVFKTPLNERLLSRVPRQFHFTTADLMRTLAMRGQRLGVIIDLTDTDRYYDRRDFESLGINVEKIYCGGRGFVDQSDLAERFNRVVEKFTDHHDKEALIGVHCTRGVNRSGFLVCRFLIERLGWSSHQAIEAFENARGCPIEKGAYVRALHAVAREARLRDHRPESDGEASSHGSRRKKEKRDKKKEFPDTFDPSKKSTAQKRRERKRRTQQKFEVMKRGKFHEIQEMREKLGGP